MRMVGASFARPAYPHRCVSVYFKRAIKVYSRLCMWGKPFLLRHQADQSSRRGGDKQDKRAGPHGLIGNSNSPDEEVWILVHEHWIANSTAALMLLN